MSDVFECMTCSHRTFYRKDRCPNCGSSNFTNQDPGIGDILSITCVHVTPEGVREPNYLGLVSFRDGGNLIAQLDEDLEVGDIVQLIDGYTLRQEDDKAITGPRVVSAGD